MSTQPTQRDDDRTPSPAQERSDERTQDQVPDLGAKQPEQDEQVKGGMIRQFDY